LSLDPEQRFPTMEPLLAEIQAALHPPSMQVAMGAAALAMVLVAAVSAWGWRDRTKTQLCSGGSAEIAAVWSPAMAGGVQGAFAAVAPVNGLEAARALTPTLDGYAQRWAQAHREACEATRIRGEQTEAILALRMVCLERRRKELAALVRLLEHPDAALVDRASDAVGGLSAVGQCGDAEALAQVGMPEDPARRASLDKLEEQLAKVDALRIAGRYPQGRDEASVAVSVAKGLAFKPLHAQSLYQLGMLEDATGDQKSAARELQEAWKLAEAGHDDVTKVFAASRLGFVTGYRQLQFEAGVAWIHVAESTLDRLGTEHYPELESDVFNVLGLVHLRAGDWRAAADAFQRSLAPGERCADADFRKARAFANLGVVRGNMGEREEAVKSERLAIAAFERLRGKDHPILVEPLQNLSNDLAALGRYPEALSAADRALELVETKMGKDHATVADVLDSRAGVHLLMGRPRQALEDAQRALAIHQKSKAATEAEAFSLDTIGRAQLALKKVPEAVAALERANALKPSDEEVMAEIRFALARALTAARRDPARARALAAEARANYQGMKDAQKVAEVDAWLASSGGRGLR
jgi:tetratricopeptide (TPR) repeat protein